MDGNGKDVTPSEYKNKSYSINTLNQAFVVPKVSLGDKYILYVNYNVNYDNSLTNFASEARSYSTLIRDNEGITNYYLYSIPEAITNEGIYFISIQFFKDDRVIDETTLEYRLIY